MDIYCSLTHQCTQHSSACKSMNEATLVQVILYVNRFCIPMKEYSITHTTMTNSTLSFPLYTHIHSCYNLVQSHHTRLLFTQGFSLSLCSMRCSFSVSLYLFLLYSVSSGTLRLRWMVSRTPWSGLSNRLIYGGPFCPAGPLRKLISTGNSVSPHFGLKTMMTLMPGTKRPLLNLLYLSPAMAWQLP